MSNRILSIGTKSKSRVTPLKGLGWFVGTECGMYQTASISDCTKSKIPILPFDLDKNEF